MKKKFLILIPLVLASFVHLLNPVGYPEIFFDEGIYMRRAMTTIETGSPQESYLYDHPYLGQLILAGVLQITNYPPDVSADPQSLQSLYLIPRLFMGMLAILSTFLVYLIAREKFGTNVALISSTLFAVMPYTWIFDRILLDSILLPFLLASILLAIHYAKPEGKVWLAPLSGILLGLAIFTKIPAFVFIPLVIWLVYQKRRKFSDMIIWIMPVLLIPMLWPANAIMLDQFDLWINDVLWQSQRSNSIFEIIGYFLYIDPVLFAIGMTGIVYAGITRNKFVLFWFVPFMVFLSLVGFKQYFHWIPLIPILCIAASIWLLDLPKKIKTLQSKRLHGIVIVSILVFGLSSTLLVITNDMSITQFEALSFVLQNQDDKNTILASPVYTWILYDVFDISNVPIDYSMILFYPIPTNVITVIADEHFMLDRNRGVEIIHAYNNTESIQSFENVATVFDNRIYPYTNLRVNQEGMLIDIREGQWIKP
ncbi:glycosyl transferase family protein [Candidatus Nitrosopumilus koreensis AR1]|uniref:Glycosyl transferase family protein n=1 Tax=Candidatus Nitrosopumilus koreensis AR1 TaxID=1229908 RepID=K0B7G6_9ARCH|nr:MULTISPECIES: glycosyltransferase family 39 protein [Nitrosopumilus]AFS81112.1 glycosyl transferase family protein [Candidatus Nitrosopumilus koreensis AR1]